jgi:hypothetical protein
MYEYQNKGFAKWAFRKCMKRKDEEGSGQAGAEFPSAALGMNQNGKNTPTPPGVFRKTEKHRR